MNYQIYLQNINLTKDQNYDIINKVIELNKQEIFKQEISYVKDSDIKESLCTMIDTIPDYFFHIPASSTGKYHPRYAVGKGGLLRHSKAAVRIGYELLQDPIIGDKYTNKEKDLMLIALTIHDGIKYGFEKEEYTRFDHPLLAAEYLDKNKKNMSFSDDEIEFMKKVISSHMGAWNTDYNGNEVLPIPKTKYETFVHMCDYLASRKSIILEFDDDNNYKDQKQSFIFGIINVVRQ